MFTRKESEGKGASDTSHDGIRPMADKGTNHTRNCKVQVKYITIESIKSRTRFEEKGFGAGVRTVTVIDMCFAFLKTKENCQLMKSAAT